MNDLSWFLYLAGTLPQLSTAIGVLSGVATVIFGCVFLIYIIDKVEDGICWEIVQPWRFAWLWCATLFVATFLVPDKETFYAIAASEMGEEVINSKIGGKAQQALEEWLDRQIEENSPTAKETASE